MRDDEVIVPERRREVDTTKNPGSVAGTGVVVFMMSAASSGGSVRPRYFENQWPVFAAGRVRGLARERVRTAAGAWPGLDRLPLVVGDEARSPFPELMTRFARHIPPHHAPPSSYGIRIVAGCDSVSRAT
jgi:hypothetical protein